MDTRLYSKLAMAGLIGVVAFPEIAAAACKSWDLGSSYVIRQQNGYVVTLSRLTRDGSKFEASAKSPGVGRGDASGSLATNGRFKFNIDWDNGSVGIYTALVEDDGSVVDGRTYDKAHPASWSTWTGDSIGCNDLPEEEGSKEGQ
jgi:hypothetical protein